MIRFSRLYSLSATGLLAAATLFLPTAAFADTLNFALTDGSNNMTFNIHSTGGARTGTPSTSDANTSTFSVSAIVNGGSATTDRVGFYSAFHGGGLVLRDAGRNIVLSQTGYPSATLFTGAISSPTFKLGTFSFTDDGGAQFTSNFSITITGLTPPAPTTPTPPQPRPNPPPSSCSAPALPAWQEPAVAGRASHPDANARSNQK